MRGRGGGGGRGQAYREMGRNGYQEEKKKIEERNEEIINSTLTRYGRE